MPQKSKLSLVVDQWGTKDRDVLCEVLSKWFPGISKFSFSGLPEDYRFQSSSLFFDAMCLMRHSCTGLQCEFPMFETMCINIPMQGHSAYATKTSDVRAKPGRVAIAQYGDGVNVNLSPDYTGLFLMVPASALRKQASKLLGIDYEPRLEDLGAGPAMIDVEKGPGAALVRSAYGALKDAEQLSEMGLGALVGAQTYDHLANLLLVAALPNVRERLQQPEKDTGLRAIEKARQYLEAQADQPVRISDVASDLGISVRALQLGFRKQFGKTPLEFLFECKMQNARQLLLAAPPGASVTSIALDCGFSNVGAFAGRYRMAFGELPSETLARRARG